MNIQMKAKHQQGFTIIELVVVILLLGILAATALPRFLDVTEEAHDAVVDGTASALQTGMALYRAQWIAQRQPAAGQTLTGGTEFGALRAGSSGFPVGNTNGATTGTFTANTTGQGNTQCLEIYNNILQAGRAPVVTSNLANNNDIPVDTDIDTTQQGFVAKYVTNVSSIGTGTTATALDTADRLCVYVYAADAARRLPNSQDVPALVYFPFTSGSTDQIAAGTVIEVVL